MTLSHLFGGRIRPLSVCFLSLASVVSFSSEIVYDNSLTLLTNTLGSPYFADERIEYGDELNLSGQARTVTDFLFEAYGDFVPNGDEQVKVRFYANNTVLSPVQIAPGTLLYESSWEILNPKYNTLQLGGLDVLVPDNFTFTVQFRGLRMTPGDSAGLLFYSPPTIGSSFNDYWAKVVNPPRPDLFPNDQGFRISEYEEPSDLAPGLTFKNNFGVRVIAVPEPGVLAMMGAGLLVLATGALRRRR